MHIKRERVKWNKCPSTFTSEFGAKQHEKGGHCGNKRAYKVRDFLKI